MVKYAIPAIWWVGLIKECQLNKNTTSSPTQQLPNNPHISFLFLCPNSPKQLKSHKLAPPPATITTASLFPTELTSSRQGPPWSGVNNPPIHAQRERERERCVTVGAVAPVHLEDQIPLKIVDPHTRSPALAPRRWNQHQCLHCHALRWCDTNGFCVCKEICCSGSVCINHTYSTFHTIFKSIPRSNWNGSPEV